MDCRKNTSWESVIEVQAKDDDPDERGAERLLLYFLNVARLLLWKDGVNGPFLILLAKYTKNSGHVYITH